MKISVNDQELFTLSETQKKVIKNDIHEDIFDEDMKRRIQYIINHKYEKCLERLKQEWIPKIKDRFDSIPTNDDSLAQLIISQPDYKDRHARDNEEKLNRNPN